MLLLRCFILGAFISADGQRVIRARVGQRADLQCVTPPTIISDWQRLYVQRPMEGALPVVVFSFSEGREEPQYQDRRFQNRTQLNKQNLTLSLSDVGPQDKGQYDCTIFSMLNSKYHLTHKEQLILSVWADYQRPQIRLLRGGTENAITCSAQDGYPKANIGWKLHPPVADLATMTVSWSESHPHTQLYNVSGWLNISASINGSASCCVVTQEAELCSNLLELTASSGVGGQRQLSLACIILGLFILAWSR